MFGSTPFAAAPLGSGSPPPATLDEGGDSGAVSGIGGCCCEGGEEPPPDCDHPDYFCCPTIPTPLCPAATPIPRTLYATCYKGGSAIGTITLAFTASGGPNRWSGCGPVAWPHDTHGSAGCSSAGPANVNVGVCLTCDGKVDFNHSLCAVADCAGGTVRALPGNTSITPCASVGMPTSGQQLPTSYDCDAPSWSYTGLTCGPVQLGCLGVDGYLIDAMDITA